MSVTALALLLAVAAADEPAPEATGRLVLTLGGVRELGQAALDPATGQPSPALAVPSPDTLFWADLRGTVDAPSGRVDFRLRLTPDDPWQGVLRQQGQSVITARGALGGREYELRELYVTGGGLTVGRQIVSDADALTLDGARLSGRFGAWRAEAFGGLAPNPFSRSLDTDYREGDGLAPCGGVDAAYDLPEAHGALALAGVGFAGQGAFGADQPPRIFVAWRNYFRPWLPLDIASDVVADLYGETGPTLTRGQLALNLRLARALRVELSYAHLSAFALGVYLKRYLLREPDPSFLPIENNLVLSRTARNEARLLINLDLAGGRLALFASGRLLHRSVVEQLDPRLAPPDADAIDLSLGLRDRRGFAGFRPALTFDALYGYRSEVRIASASIERDLARGAGLVTLQGGFTAWRDAGYARPCDPQTVASCFGATEGSAIDLGGLVWYRFSRRWFTLVDAHLVANAATSASGRDPTVYTVLGLLRLQARF
jgi:hypothetical protein